MNAACWPPGIIRAASLRFYRHDLAAFVIRGNTTKTEVSSGPIPLVLDLKDRFFL